MLPKLQKSKSLSRSEGWNMHIGNILRYRNRTLHDLFLIGLFLLLVAKAVPIVSIQFQMVLLRPDQLLLLVLTLLIFFPQATRHPKPHPKGQNLPVYLGFLSISFIIFSNLFIKGPSYPDLRQIKNVLLFLVLAYVLANRFLLAGVKPESMLLAITLGLTVAILILLPQIRFSGQIVRPPTFGEFQETTGVSFSGLALSGGLALLAGITHTLWKGPIRRLLRLPVIVVSVAAISVAGIRATIYPLLFLPLVVYAVEKMSKRCMLITLSGMVGLSLLISTCPGVISDILPAGRPAGVIGAERLYSIGTFFGDIQTRLIDWDNMLYDRSFEGLLFGIDWQTSMNQSQVLLHPHNIFVWTQILGGGIANLLFAISLAGMFYLAYLAYRSASWDMRPITRLVLMGYVLFLCLWISNSWIKGSEILLGLWVALTSFLYTACCWRKA